MADIIQQRRDTAARWAQYNPILMEGEVGYVTDNPNQYKIGNGRDSWNNLPLRGYTGTITQDTGDDENAVMSQKATTEKLSELGSYVENNPEYARAYTDAEGKFLWGIKQDGSIEWAKGVPTPVKKYIESLDLENNPEYARAYTDAEGKFLWGIKKDGSIEWAKGVPTPVKKYIESLDLENDEEIERINQLVIDLLADVKVLTDTYHYVSNPELVQVVVDSEGKILEGIRNDGKKFFPKQEMLEKCNDIEGRAEMTLDSDGKILSYRDSDGVKHEHKQHTEKASFGNMELSDNNAKQIEEALKRNGFMIKSPIDWSEEEYVEIPIPEVCAKLNIICDELPKSNTDEFDGLIEFSDKDGNYFKKPITSLAVQGDTSRLFEFKNMSFDLADDSKVKFGTWVAQDSWHLKKYYIDAFRGQCVVAYWLAEQIYQTHEIGNRKPYEYLYNNNKILTSNGDFKKDMPTGALTHPDGFPIMLYHNGVLVGLYAWCLKKHRDNYAMKKSDERQIILDGTLSGTTIWGGAIDWASFEVRNPKGLIDINGNEYDGDNPKELSNEENFSKLVKTSIERLSTAFQVIESEETNESKREKFKEFFNVDYLIDYFIFGNFINDFDGFAKNWIWCTWDGLIWAPTVYDKDSIFGSSAQGTVVHEAILNELHGTIGNSPSALLWKLFKEDIVLRYRELVDGGILTVDNVLDLLYKWIYKVGYDNLKTDIEECCVDDNGEIQTPSYRNPKLNDGWEIIGNASNNSVSTYNNDTVYNEGDTCDFCNPDASFKWGLKFRATKTVQGIPPLSGFYTYFPTEGGYFNSPTRIKNWLLKRIEYLNNVFINN